jgi:hypothetical protein
VKDNHDPADLRKEHLALYHRCMSPVPGDKIAEKYGAAGPVVQAMRVVRVNPDGSVECMVRFKPHRWRQICYWVCAHFYSHITILIEKRSRRTH